MDEKTKDIDTAKRLLKEKLSCLEKRKVLDYMLPLNYEELDKETAIEVLCALGWEYKNSTLSKEETELMISNILGLPFMSKLSIGEQKRIISYNNNVLHYFNGKDIRLQKAAIRDERGEYNSHNAAIFPKDIYMRRQTLYLAIVNSEYHLQGDLLKERFNALSKYDQDELIEKVYMKSIRMGRNAFGFDCLKKRPYIYYRVLYTLVNEKKNMIDDRKKKGYPIRENDVFNDAEKKFIGEMYNICYKPYKEMNGISDITIIDILKLEPSLLKNEGLTKYLEVGRRFKVYAMSV
jgi:hypothetical protein